MLCSASAHQDSTRIYTNQHGGRNPFNIRHLRSTPLQQLSTTILTGLGRRGSLVRIQSPRPLFAFAQSSVFSLRSSVAAEAARCQTRLGKEHPQNGLAGRRVAPDQCSSQETSIASPPDASKQAPGDPTHFGETIRNATGSHAGPERRAQLKAAPFTASARVGFAASMRLMTSKYARAAASRILVLMPAPR
jgi:hypothetical protein